MGAVGEPKFDNILVRAMRRIGGQGTGHHRQVGRGHKHAENTRRRKGNNGDECDETGRFAENQASPITQNSEIPAKLQVDWQMSEVFFTSSSRPAVGRRLRRRLGRRSGPSAPPPSGPSESPTRHRSAPHADATVGTFDSAPIGQSVCCLIHAPLGTGTRISDQRIF